MGSIDDEIQAAKLNSSRDCCENGTQPFDSQSPPPSLLGEKLKDKDFYELQFQQCTLPMVDTVPLEDAFETQAINLAGETQVLDDPDGAAFETQAIDIAGETQVLDDPDGAANMGAQLLGNCDYEVVVTDGEGSDATEVLDDSVEFSDNDSAKRVGICAVHQENKLYSSAFKEDERGFKAKLDGLDIELQSSGFKQKTSTSVHAASWRACSSAAHIMALKGTSDESSLIKSDTQSLKQHTSAVKEIAVIKNSSALGVEVDLEDFSGKCNEQIKGSGNENKCRVGSSIVKRLFMNDTLGEIEGPDNCTNNADLPHLPACGDEVAGLSYVDSQEPGELSQDNALNFVDRFLKFNVMDVDQEGDIGRSTGEKSKPVSSTKGIQSLAKRTSFISTAGERGTFDWDDSLEDEGGGEFFTKKKEAFFDDGGGRRKRSCTKHQKVKNYSKGCGAVDETRDKGIVSQNSKRKDKTVNIIDTKPKKNVTEELDEQLKTGASDGTEATVTDKEMLNVGFDTQMAAEAMEALCFGLDVANCDNEDSHDGTNNLNKGSSRGEKGDRAWSATHVRRTRSSLVKKCHLQTGFFTPIACRTRQRSVTNPLRAGIAPYNSGKASILNPKQSGVNENVNEQEKPYQKVRDTIAAVRIGEFRRTRRKFSGQLNGNTNPHGSVNQIVGQKTNGQSPGKSNRSKTNGLKRKNRESTNDGPVSPAVDKGVSGFAALECNSTDGNVAPKDMVGALTSKPSDRQRDADTISGGGNTKLQVSPGDKCKPSGSVSANCTTPVSAVSPICVGDEYLKQSCRKNLSRSFLMREIKSLISNSPEATSTTRDSRMRREMANVRVLFSHHLNGDMIKQQKKILARLGASVASSISEATHFVTDEFVRTRNMLEAIALGKPVVTHLWLESCGQAGCFIDERTYILRDAKKEKEFGFSLPVSLARACQRPLLQGQKVLITPNTKPCKELLASLVKAVHGEAVERIGRSAFKDGEILEEFLVLSCEEDYAICAPFLEKGAAVYSSELLLKGIVTQKLEYERHRLFADHIK
ncbi:hypothetical protein RHGRI_012464 [Rhododendron griersonianum]|uniref:BRCT domain-containing protein n=1 Tax=Rhododendron griersonianum TaxID=479676 RepID=A0AAV6KRN1_9ERIC|nr:hypothetical protein RHGRI_012464 [Rhododendron griersonianum]